MSRNEKPQPILAVFLRNGNTCTPDTMDCLSTGEKSLLASLSYCLLGCRDHIVYSHEQPVIDILCRGAVAGWAITNWSQLSPALQYALNEVFSSNSMLPPRSISRPAA